MIGLLIERGCDLDAYPMMEGLGLLCIDLHVGGCPWGSKLAMHRLRDSLVVVWVSLSFVCVTRDRTNINTVVAEAHPCDGGPCYRGRCVLRASGP